MKKILFLSILFCFAFTNTSFAQSATEKQAKERYEKETQKQKDKFIQDFLDELEIDDFQKEILKQKLYAYIEKKEVIFKLGLQSYERKDKVEELDATHFLEIENILSEGVMEKIQELIKGENIKKKKKDKKRKKKKNKD